MGGTAPAETANKENKMNAKTPVLKLNNSVELPALGLGVYLSPPDQTASAVQNAIANGYRLIDTAAAYGNEQQVGEGIARSNVERDQLFVMTKLWIADYGYDEARRAFDASMAKLRLDYLDLYLLHWPAPSTWQVTLASWRAAEALLAERRVRAIGVCNFTERHLQELRKASEIVPAVNQVELHPFCSQRELRAANARLGIITQAWSPIGGTFTNHPREPSKVTRLLDHPVLTQLAKTCGRTPAQIVLRWHMQNGVAAIPKSVHPDRIAANIDIFDFTLSKSAMAAIDALDTGQRNGPDPDVFDMAVLRARRRSDHDRQPQGALAR
jgi:diketogulonate reductase-like aldo/keto reductase